MRSLCIDVLFAASSLEMELWRTHCKGDQQSRAFPWDCEILSDEMNTQRPTNNHKH